MLLQQVLLSPQHPDYSIISQRCSTFLEESKGLCLLKALPKSCNDIHKVKARKRNITGTFAEAFNDAFSEHVDNISQRAIFANGESSFVLVENKDFEPFYIFPINGYRYLYCPEVDNSSDDYKQVLETVLEQFGSDKGQTIIRDLLKFAYNTENLSEGIAKGAEIVIYNIPFYYAVRVSSVQSYETLLSNLSNTN